jgi:hypothetical protein
MSEWTTLASLWRHTPPPPLSIDFRRPITFYLFTLPALIDHRLLGALAVVVCGIAVSSWYQRGRGR